MSDSAGLTRREALKRGATVGGAAMVWAAPSTSAFAMSTSLAQSTSPGAGCSPGFWKNNLRHWPYDPGSPLSTHFDFENACADLKGLGTATLLDALSFGGGRGVVGATQILFRAAVASLLNVKEFYPNSLLQSEVRGPVNALLESCGPREAIIELAEHFDSLNNRGCPLDGDGAADR